jgi:hypothetical protein
MGALSAIEKDFQSLGLALQSGNISGAQQAFTQLAQDAKSLSGAQPRHQAENSGGSSSSELMQALLSNQPPAAAGSQTTRSSPVVGSSLDVSA